MTACSGIACDSCPKPGRCCTGLVLNGGELAKGTTMLAALATMATLRHQRADGRMTIGAPFMPLMQRGDGEWLWWCPNLQADGRCGDYENRPEPCWRYTAGDDFLCVMHVPSIEDLHR